MEIKFKCMRCDGLHDEIENAAYCSAQIQRVAVCWRGFKTVSPEVAQTNECEEIKC